MKRPGKLYMALGGLGLWAVAKLQGVRVTSWWRSAERNREVNGHPNSWHVDGGALDIGRETPADKAALLDRLSSSSLKHDVGSGVHWHFQAGKGAVVVGSFVVALVVVLLYMVVRDGL